MSNGTGTQRGGRDRDEIAPGSLADALLVYAEPLASEALAIVIGSAESSVAERLIELGARRVHLFDPDPARASRCARAAPRDVSVRALTSDVDLRDLREGTFDLAVIHDLADLERPRLTVAALRRALAEGGSVVAMGRAKIAEDEDAPFASELGPAALEYAELYDLFASEFDDVSLAGVVPFEGVVFAQLGAEEESPPVSVDTRLSDAPAPRVFVVVAGQRTDRAAPLDPYSIVQLPTLRAAPHDTARHLEATVVSAQIKAEMLSAQLEEARDRLATADGASSEVEARLDRASSERDAALTRAMELEAVLAASQQTMATLERRLLEAEQGILLRDERIAAQTIELAAQRSTAPVLGTDVVDVGEIIARGERAEVALATALAEIAAREEAAQLQPRISESELTALVLRAERAEAALALHVADLAQVAEAHAAETAGYEEQLRDRAHVIAGLEKELVRREQLVKELVASLEESRDGVANGVVFEAAAPLSTTSPPARERHAQAEALEEIARLRSKLDELASEVARREGELAARAWRITELENARARAEPPVERRSDGRTGDLERELGRTRDELDALRQALTQEHAARVAAESGEELARARSELARQAALLEQIRSRQ